MRDRATLITSLVLLSGLAAASYWLAERARSGDVKRDQTGHVPDYFVERFSQVRLDEKGLPQYSVDSQRMTHFLDDDSTALEKPVFVSHKPDRPVVNIHADTGRLSTDGEQVHLYGNVEVRRSASADAPEFLAQTSYLLILPEEDRARTDKPVTANEGASRIVAQSMEYDNGYRNIKFNGLAHGRGQATLEPHRKLAPNPIPNASNAAVSSSASSATPGVRAIR